MLDKPANQQSDVRTVTCQILSVAEVRSAFWQFLQPLPFAREVMEAFRAETSEKLDGLDVTTVRLLAGTLITKAAPAVRTLAGRAASAISGWPG